MYLRRFLWHNSQFGNIRYFASICEKNITFFYEVSLTDMMRRIGQLYSIDVLFSLVIFCFKLSFSRFC